MHSLYLLPTGNLIHLQHKLYYNLFYTLNLFALCFALFILWIFTLSLKNAREKNLRKDVKEATNVKDIERLKLSIDKFVGAGLEDKGDYSKASTRLEFLEVQQG